jgi:hypothetical protein
VDEQGWSEDVNGARLPRVVQLGPDGEQVRTVYLSGERLTIGRSAEFNDVALAPDPQRRVSREVHCALEREHGRWYVVDGDTVNGTYLLRDEQLERVAGRVALGDEEEIRVIALVAESGARRYWRLVFENPEGTRRVDPALAPPAGTADPHPRPHAGRCLFYDSAQGKLFLVDGHERRQLRVRRQVHELVRYMAARNAEGGGVPVLCSRDELMRAIWDTPLHSPEELTRLFWELRNELRPHRAEDIVENERGLGYRLRSCL